VQVLLVLLLVRLRLVVLVLVLLKEEEEVRRNLLLLLLVLSADIVMILDPYPLFPPFYFTLSVTRLSLVPSRAARTVTKSPDKSPDSPLD